MWSAEDRRSVWLNQVFSPECFGGRPNEEPHTRGAAGIANMNDGWSLFRLAVTLSSADPRVDRSSRSSVVLARIDCVCSACSRLW